MVVPKYENLRVIIGHTLQEEVLSDASYGKSGLIIVR
jgi:hypothetical protein